MQNNRLTVTRCRRAGVGSTTFTLAQMTVAMLLWSSVMAWIYWCCWSTGHCTVIYRVISPSRWRSGTVLSYISKCHMRRMWGHHMLTAAFEPTHTIHPLRHSVLHCRQGQNVNAENTEGVGFPRLFEKNLVCCLPQ